MNPNSPRRWIAACAALFALSLAAPAEAQLQSFHKQELIDYTEQNPFDRLPDGRPRVPDELLERAQDLSAEDIWATLQQKGVQQSVRRRVSRRAPGEKPRRARVHGPVHATASRR